jgi:sulfatase modifying factor 1
MNKAIKKNILSLVSLTILLLMGLGTALDAPHSYMSAVYEEDSAAGRDIREEGFTIPGLGMEMVCIKPGRFSMGTPERDEDRCEDELPHDVTLTQGFWLGKREVTVGDFKKFVEATGYRAHSEMANALYNSVTKERIGGKNWRNIFGNDLNQPVVGVSKNDAYAFCEWLTGREHKAGRLPEDYTFTLPTEAQWEYACRAESSTRFSFGDSYDELYRYANYADRNTNVKDRDETHDDGYGYAAPVGSFEPNRWGLYDMHGNVSELIADTYWRAYQEGEVIDPLGPAVVRTDSCLIRGGGWSSPPKHARSAARLAVPAMDSYCDIGFRVVLRREYTAIVYCLTGANGDWSLITKGDTSRISHKQLSSAKISNVIHFPDRRSLGFPKARIQGKEMRWVDLPVRATGKLEVPEGVEVKLHVPQVNIKSDADLAPLESLKPDDLQAIELSEGKMGSAALKHIANLTGLREVQINSRRVRDSGLKFLSALPYLERLELGGTKIRGPGLDYLRRCNRLHYLGLGGTKLDNAGLEHMAKLRQLRVLKVGHTKLGGDDHGYLKPISDLKELRELDLSGTSVTNAELVHLSGLRNLEDLCLAETPITGEGLKHLANVESLRALDLRRTAVGDTGLGHLARLTNLEKLSAGEMREISLYAYEDSAEIDRDDGNPRITDEGLRHLSEMKNLEILRLSGTNITGKGFSYLTGLKDLRFLGLKDCQLNDAGLAHIAKLKGLEEIDISGNMVTDSGLAHLLGASNLKRVVAVGTQVTERAAEDFMKQTKDVEVILEESLDEEFQS